MIHCYGYATDGPRSSLRLFKFVRRDIGDNDIRIDIEYCGVCHTDIHKSHNDWGNSLFPMVPGHEIVGRVAAVGRNVSRFRIGDYAGVGCIVDSCRQCSSCLAALPQYCESGPVSTYNSQDRRDGTVTYGGYSTTIVVDEHYAVRIPSKIRFIEDYRGTRRGS
ncbi:alcohol dehydrogenase catalytic domain-containing protein [Burkholderia contaminans]|uniref:alcohol dehydrogenase catalytic domain-containing protein n=1 Tax=Burkholderia contaminans TaxID=488447 RepID=UPI001582CF92|nr:alcohol dehydrogenase catalytic domain-containing protein [Burkholderia contaminans]MCA8157978.1 alcohol dehydrogenase catalytic domain-containing protein [Burkholderia contaminans]